MIFQELQLAAEILFFVVVDHDSIMIIAIKLQFYYFTCRYANARAPPPVDLEQNIMNATAEEVMINGSIYTIVNFIRPVLAANPDDLSLMEDAFILYAWGTENNFNASDLMSIAFHGANVGRSPELISFLCPGLYGIPVMYKNIVCNQCELYRVCCI